MEFKPEHCIQYQTLFSSRSLKQKLFFSDIKWYKFDLIPYDSGYERRTSKSQERREGHLCFLFCFCVFVLFLFV